MINILIASHSKKLAEGLREILIQMAPNVNILVSGGDKDGNIGSNFNEINQIINEYSTDGLVIFFDLGSSMMNCQMAIDMLDDEKKSKVYLAGTPIVETSVQIAVEASAGQSLEKIVEYLNEYPVNKLEN
ncbi:MULTISPECIES: dihydroxyacetone kinase phosphoryl donor subunit DhaM [Anaerococcus]|uniref:phosphoenolpyruvate--glycerone phosphotransferase n=1 Tax=Anaerococcus vaginalis TaxID=33037 RepID=A0A6N2U3G6_9FIRM|nr:MULTISPECIES: dihydroxyacetone kinase phosphoryl donor subunit DhaM [Anaerococcus]MBS6921602.1 PTS-dependent dihydroxyacetone kinase phosphotransferase subunit DhaM [Anaerococcus vaginalis]MDU1707688.1 dihydroxyacetone kinase phosphoryl donor subunit DhaM [Anaerococcus vaginalis]MDU1763935.1 dihydroxyacetone kinase phosphoryl donor subunit DhaM [Anaerococcus vaginalis]MDU5988644.1 dihydroxyacetone kinase phosphoryl donor subunit DhaM [Anaerococcus vaginalis]OFO45149.1 PTS system fructose su